MKFRASYSILNVWQSGNYERAVEMYFKLKEFTTRAMHEGKEKHKEWEEEVKKTGKMPIVFGGKQLFNPKTELKIVRQLDDWLELVGKIDLLDETTIYDWKYGKIPSERYANGFQPKTYQILIPKAKRAEIHHYDPISKRADMSIIHLTEKTLKDAIEWCVTNASEMHSYFQDNKLYERFQAQLDKKKHD